MKRRDFLGTLGAGVAAVAASGLASRLFAGEGRAMSSGKRPNVLMLYTDDQRYDSVRALGTGVVQTPTMDSLVARGTTFTNPYIMGSTQGAVCVCSRACLMTGRTLWRAPAQLPPEFPLWPEVMKQAGYATYGIGKWHNGAASYARSFTGGADIFFGGMSNHLAVPVHDFDPSGQYPKTAARKGDKFSSELFSDAAVQFLRGHPPDKPFFLYVAYTAPHDPRMAPEEYKAMYPPEKVPVPPNFMPQHPFDNGELKVRDEMLAPHPRTPQVVQEHIAAYYAMITHLDEQMGRVLKALQESGHADDTIIVFGGDNGLAVGQHGLFGKQNLYEHSLRVPFVMAGPGVPKGETRDALVYHLDIFPTISEMVGAAAPATVEGKSLVPVLADKSRRVRDTLFGAYRDVQRMVRDERYKLIKYSVKGEKHTQLFDLAADPWEMKDLSADPARAGTLAALDAKLAEWQKATDDPVLKA